MKARWRRPGDTELKLLFSCVYYFIFLATMAQEPVEDNSPVPNLALSLVLVPALAELEGLDAHSVETLKAAFGKAEKAAPGITQEVLAGILSSELPQVNLNEAILRKSAKDTSEITLNRTEEEFTLLSKKAKDLKKILSKIPDEINDRAKFLQTIKDIASTIKELLDAVNDVFRNCQGVGKMREYKKPLEQNKKEFVKYSKSFSDTLKRYFKDGKADSVFLSANRLINQTNNILSIFALAVN